MQPQALNMLSFEELNDCMIGEDTARLVIAGRCSLSRSLLYVCFFYMFMDLNTHTHNTLGDQIYPSKPGKWLSDYAKHVRKSRDWS